jgi:hypothetical protein
MKQCTEAERAFLDIYFADEPRGYDAREGAIRDAVNAVNRERLLLRRPELTAQLSELKRLTEARETAIDRLYDGLGGSERHALSAILNREVTP